MISPKLALRTLFKSPFITTVAIVSLALGIGANAAIFSLFNQMVLRPLPVPEPQRLVNLEGSQPNPGSQSCTNAGNCNVVLSYPMFRDLERVQTVFTGIAAHRSFGANLAYKHETLSGEGMLVSGSYFPTLAIRPAVGRLLDTRDDRAPGQSPVVVLSYEYWQTHFGEDRGVVGETLIVNGEALTIVGVAPRGFECTTLGRRPHVFVPITLRELMSGARPAPGRLTRLEDRRAYWVYAFGRLKPGVSMDQARTAINVPYRAIINDVEAPLQQNMSDERMKQFRAKRLGVEDGMRGQSMLRGGANKASLVLMLGVTGLVLLIACANIANLLLARGASRSAEMAVRLSIGAGRGQLVAQLLAEACLLAILGGIASLLVARWTLHLIASLLPPFAVKVATFDLDPAAVVFTGALTLVTAIVFGLFPALHATRADLAGTLKGQAGQPSGGRAAVRFRTSLATAQIALSMALLIGAGLFVRSLVNLSRTNLGFDVDQVVTFSISPQMNGYTPERSRALFERLEDDVAAMPGVTRAAAAIVPLITGESWGSDVAVQGFRAGPDTDVNSRFNKIGAGYFRTVGVPLLSGREFTRADVLGAGKVAIVNEEFAKKFNLGRNAVGKHISTNSQGGELDIEIVGLVQNAKYSQVKEDIPPVFFLPYRQDANIGFLTFYVRTTLEPEQLLPQLRKVVARADPNLPVNNLLTMPQQIRENVFLDRLMTTMSAAFAILATLLAAIGLYGVLAYTVAQRTREIGLRMALGAEPVRVRTMVLRQVARMTAAGGVVGLAAAVMLGRKSESLLFGLKGFDPAVFACGAALIAAIALAAGFLPAVKASRIDPMRALRYE